MWSFDQSAFLKEAGCVGKPLQSDRDQLVFIISESQQATNWCLTWSFTTSILNAGHQESSFSYTITKGVNLPVHLTVVLVIRRFLTEACLKPVRIKKMLLKNVYFGAIICFVSLNYKSQLLWQQILIFSLILLSKKQQKTLNAAEQIQCSLVYNGCYVLNIT